jgi:hypothetical protein
MGSMLVPGDLLERLRDPAPDRDGPGDAGAPACAIWEFPRGVDLALVSESAENGYEEPDFVARELARTADTLTFEVVRGVARYDDRILYFVERLGAFELVARDAGWDRGTLRVRLVLRAL